MIILLNGVKMKRLLDIIFSIILLIILFPFFIIISICILIEDGTPIIFKQERIGKDGKRFTMYKFRTMVNNKKNNFFYISENDNRITKVGKFLRKTRIDELIQLLNVLKADMSFVGVRPDVDEHFKYYTEKAKKEYCKYRPGIYGLAAFVYQNEGFLLNKESDKKAYYIKHLLPKKCELNKIYNDNYSLLLDFKIILASFKILKKIKINKSIYYVVTNY